MASDLDLEPAPQVTAKTPATPEAASRVLDRPQTTEPIRIAWMYVVPVALIHVLALLAFVPYFFSWTGVVLAVCGLYVFGTLGINLCYHRLLTHQGFTCPKWLERTWALLGVCCLEDTPARWVAIHRMHHKDSDEQPDPHSPLVTFLWGHMGWLFVTNRDHQHVLTYERYSRDLLKDPFYLTLEKQLLWAVVYLVHAGLFFAAGAAAGWLIWGSAAALQFGLSVLVWGVLVRTVAVWHITWSVNSITHIWGYRNYETKDNSRNNWFVGLVSNGEGWHNNHHADQRAAAHGHKWWEFDVTWITISVLEKVGLVKNVVRPKVWQDGEAH